MVHGFEPRMGFSLSLPLPRLSLWLSLSLKINKQINLKKKIISRRLAFWEASEQLAMDLVQATCVGSGWVQEGRADKYLEEGTNQD